MIVTICSDVSVIPLSSQLVYLKLYVIMLSDEPVKVAKRSAKASDIRKMSVFLHKFLWPWKNSMICYIIVIGDGQDTLRNNISYDTVVGKTYWKILLVARKGISLQDTRYFQRKYLDNASRYYFKDTTWKGACPIISFIDGTFPINSVYILPIWVHPVYFSGIFQFQS